MELYLVRHGVTTETGSRLTGRIPGVALSDAGREQAEATARFLAPQKVSTVYTSPVQRCSETAAIISREISTRARNERRVQEVDYGAWQGRTLNSLRKLKAWQALFVAPARFRFPDGETLAEAQHRAVSAIEEIAERHPRERVVVVSHADIIRVTLAHYLGMPLDMVHRLDVRPASVSKVILNPGSFPTVAVVNHQTS
ncbi:MAG: histidine phosphatase family protein [Acidimicrobiia bacterium]|nr:histidine phosphatase family protein [Acidimicrobiia bacterium]NNC73907.1 phosphoglycerate mutase [Acidimicrobiia bacterium]